MGKSARDVTIGIAGAAGDGLDKTGDTLARTASRLGLYVVAYNSYQSLIRGGHTWLRIRLSEGKIHTHGDRVHALIALNQDSIGRHAREVEPGGVIFFNGDKLECDYSDLLKEGVQCLGIPVRDLIESFGRVPPVMQNSVMLGAMLYWLNLDFDMTKEVLADTFRHKGQDVIDLNVGVALAGYAYAEENYQRSDFTWNFSRKRRPFMTGNESTAMGAVAGGMKFYAAYPMTPATSILHWLVAHGERTGVMVKQAEDELAVANMAIGAGVAGVRSMCGTSGGGFALMTEAIGQAGMFEAPVVFVLVQRGGPSTGLPTKTEQADLNQAFGASQGDYPRVIVAPSTVPDAFYTAAEAHNLGEEFQLPVIIVSDKALGESPLTVDAEDMNPEVTIERGKLLSEVPEGYKRYDMSSPDHVSPRVVPGTPGTTYVTPSDDHDEDSVLISDVYTNTALRRKMQEKRMRKMEAVIQKLPPPELEGPVEADVTLVGWGSTWGAIHEAIELLAEEGITANHLHIKYIVPFHADEVAELLSVDQPVIVVEGNSGQMARHIRAETGIKADGLLLKYDGEPLTPGYIVKGVKAILDGKVDRWPPVEVSEAEARKIAYHYIRVKMGDNARPIAFEQVSLPDVHESVWRVGLVDRNSGESQGALFIGVETGSTYGLEA
jgi:2-oxoglutarate ferredoxin oxidoreductase subunit alpha